MPHRMPKDCDSNTLKERKDWPSVVERRRQQVHVLKAVECHHGNFRGFSIQEMKQYAS